MVCTFFVSYVNTAILTLATNANFEFAPFPFWILPIRLVFPDFTKDWYQ